MLEIEVTNKNIADIIFNGNNVLNFTSNKPIYEKMRVKFYCNGIYGKTYIEGFINRIYCRHKVVDSTGFEYSCEVTSELILF